MQFTPQDDVVMFRSRLQKHCRRGAGHLLVVHGVGARPDPLILAGVDRVEPHHVVAVEAIVAVRAASTITAV